VSLASKLTVAILGFAALEFHAGFVQLSIQARETPSAAQNPRIDTINGFSHLDNRPTATDPEGVYLVDPMVFDENRLHVASRDFIDRVIASTLAIGGQKPVNRRSLSRN
jgi:hypothetical protein